MNLFARVYHLCVIMCRSVSLSMAYSNFRIGIRLEMTVHAFFPFSNGIVCFLPLDFERSLCIVDTSLLLCMWLQTFLPVHVASLFILLIGTFPEEQKFLFLINFLFMDDAFSVRSKNCSPSPSIPKLFT